MKFRYISALLVSLFSSGMVLASTQDSVVTTSSNVGVSYSYDSGFYDSSWNEWLSSSNWLSTTSATVLGTFQAVGGQWYQKTQYTQTNSYDVLYQPVQATVRNVVANFTTLGSGDQWAELNLSSSLPASYSISAWASAGSKTSPRGNFQTISPAMGVGVDGGTLNSVNWTIFPGMATTSTGSINSSLQLVLEATDGGALNSWSAYLSSAQVRGASFTQHYSYLMNQWTQDVAISAPVPEPESYAMLLAGLGVISAIARRRKQMY